MSRKAVRQSKAEKLADFFGREIERNDGKTIPWENAIESEVAAYKAAKPEDLHPVSFTLDLDNSERFKTGVKMFMSEFGLTRSQAKGVFLCLAVKFAFGRISG